MCMEWERERDKVCVCESEREGYGLGITCNPDYIQTMSIFLKAIRTFSRLVPFYNLWSKVVRAGIFALCTKQERQKWTSNSLNHDTMMQWWSAKCKVLYWTVLGFKFLNHPEDSGDINILCHNREVQNECEVLYWTMNSPGIQIFRWFWRIEHAKFYAYLKQHVTIRSWNSAQYILITHWSSTRTVSRRRRVRIPVMELFIFENLAKWKGFSLLLRGGLPLRSAAKGIFQPRSSRIKKHFFHEENKQEWQRK